MGKTIGGILLVVGISIGAGILALPVATAQSGFISSTILFFVCWSLMAYCALLILEVNLWLPENSNMISMAKKTLGKPGQLIAWISYLLLLYSLLAAYIAGGGDVLHHLLSYIHIELPTWIDSFVITALLGAVVYQGTQATDYINRGLMSFKFVLFFPLLILVSPYVQKILLLGGHPRYVLGTVMVVITSFGFASLVPSLRTYFSGNTKQLKQVIIIGSVIPLILYIAWDLVILGTVPIDGDTGLARIIKTDHTITNLVLAIQHVVHNSIIMSFASAFSAVCVTTSFLGVALSLSDFLADGLKQQKQGKGNLIIYSATFLPPLLLVLFYPGAFILALQYAGSFCIILLALLPIFMVWRGRYHLNIQADFRLPGGKPALSIALVLALVALVVGFLEEIHYLH